MPVVRLLLQYGADPRLYGQPSILPNEYSVIGEAENNLIWAERGLQIDGEDPKEVAEFYRIVLEELKEAGKRLDEAEEKSKKGMWRFLASLRFW